MTTQLPDGPRGQALALGVTALAAAVLWLGVASPLMDWSAQQQAAIERQSALRDRMAGLAAALPALRREAAAKSVAQESTDAALDGDSDAVAAAGLQQSLDELAKAAGLRIGSSETLPAEEAGVWQAITVRVSLTAPWPALINLLRAIAAAPTAMVVDNVQFRPPPRDARDAERPIDASFSVTAWRARAAAP